MGKISNKRIYETVTPTGADYLVGTDAEDLNRTKSFKIQAIADFVSQNVTVGVGSLNGLVGAVTLSAGVGLVLTEDGNDLTLSLSTPDFVESINGLDGVITVQGSTNIGVTDDGTDTITLTALNLAKTNESNTFTNDQTLNRSLSVAGGVFDVDFDTQRVGVNNSTPLYPLDIVGDTSITGTTGDVLTLNSPSEVGENYILFNNSLGTDKGWVGYRGASDVLQLRSLLGSVNIIADTSVTLSYGGVTRLETTGSGVQITGDLTVGDVTASSIIITGGTSSDFLKADGSLDSTSYQDITEKGQADGYVPLNSLSKIENTFLPNDLERTTNKGAANGYAPLDSGAKIPLANIPDSVLGQVTYEGTWDVNNNLPLLANPPAADTKGEYYVCSSSGTQFGITFQTGDWIISNGTAWEKVDNTDAVTSVFGRLGNIIALESDYDAFYPTIASLSPVATSGDYTDLINTPSNLAFTNVNNNFSVGQTINGDTIINGHFQVPGLIEFNNTTLNTLLGSGAGANMATTGNLRNTAVGYEALRFNTTGVRNTAVGYQALFSNTTGNYNNAVGYEALYYNTTGEYNIANGYQAMYFNTTGEYNIAVGSLALFDNTTGDRNTALGHNTGRGITTGSANTIIGAQVAGLPAALSNTVIIADGDGNQRIRVDNSGNVLINKTTGTEKLDVNGNVKATSFIGSGASLTSVNADQLNGVDAVNYARTDIAETFNANVTIGAGAIISGNGSGLTNLDADTLGGVAAGAYAKTLDLSPVATSGDYNDLINTPPSVDSGDISNWNAAYNDKINSIAFNTGNGVVTFTQQDASVLTVDLDGRYRTSAQTLGFTSANGELSILDGNTISLDGRYMLIGGNISTLNNDSGYITSASLSPVATSGDYTDLINTPSNLAFTNVNNNFSVGQSITSSSSSGVVALMNNTDATNGFGLKITAGGSAVARYALHILNPTDTTSYFKIATETGKVGYVGISEPNPTEKLDVNGNVQATSFIGSGASLTSVNASNITTGTLADARLSSNVALKNVDNNFSVGQTMGDGLTVNRTGTSNYLLISGDNNAGIDIATGYTDGTNSVFSGMMRGTSGLTGAWNVFTGGAVRMSVDSSGNVGIGTSSTANARLVVRGAGTTSATASFEAATSGGATRFFVQDDGTSRFFGSSNAETMRIDSSGNVGIGTTSPSEKLDVNGNVKATNFISTSDSRLKTETGEVKGLEWIKRLQPKLYDKKGSTEMGFFADYIAKDSELGFMASKGQDGYYALSYTNLHATSIKAIQELDLRTERNETEFDKLKKRVDVLEKENNQLKQQLNN